MDNTINAPGPKEITRRSKDYKVKRPAAAITNVSTGKVHPIPRYVNRDNDCPKTPANQLQ